jgi:hypothetical protein
MAALNFNAKRRRQSYCPLKKRAASTKALPKAARAFVAAGPSRDLRDGPGTRSPQIEFMPKNGGIYSSACRRVKLGPQRHH